MLAMVGEILAGIHGEIHTLADFMETVGIMAGMAVGETLGITGIAQVLLMVDITDIITAGEEIDTETAGTMAGMEIDMEMAGITAGMEMEAYVKPMVTRVIMEE